MIDGRELRIGISVTNKTGVIITHISKNIIGAYVNGDLTAYPILITEKHLLDFGFEQIAQNEFEINILQLGFKYHLRKTLMTSFAVSLIIQDHAIIENQKIPGYKSISYIHELQNDIYNFTKCDIAAGQPKDYLVGVTIGYNKKVKK